MNHPPSAPLSAFRFFGRLGRRQLELAHTARGIAAFALIIVGVMWRQRRTARGLMTARIRREINRSGIELVPFFTFLALALGFLVVAVANLSALGADNLVGPIMVWMVIRVLGPLLTAIIMLARVSAANVIELGTARATGEVETLEALAIDPVHYLVVPRVFGMAAGTFALAIFLILGALGGGYLSAFVFLPQLSLTPAEYLAAISEALTPMDFLLLPLMTLTFGFFIAVVTCYHGLAQPLRLNEVSRVAVRAVTQGIVVCTLLDLLFICLYLAG